MFDLAVLSSFVAVVIGLFLIPGPAVLLTVTRTAQGGRKVGVMTGLGIATGDFIHTLFAVIGLSAILMTSSFAFNAIKIAGAAYLLYIGVRSILEKPTNPDMPKVSLVTTRSAYAQAVLTEVLNPKTALFFLAFLPQFVQPELGTYFGQFLVLGLIFVLLSIIYTTMIVMSLGPLTQLVKRIAWIGRWSGKFAGVIYIALGLKVAFQSR